MEEPLILDRYRPIADLGSGGHGSVVLAFDTRMARRVAVKRLPLPRDRAGRVVGRTGLAEARTAALLNHPAIVTVHEWDTDEDEAFIVMEDVDGASLSDILDHLDGPLHLDEAAAVLAPVVSAISFAHANGVLHLDLKPANVLVTREGRVKVADFGVSALTDSSGRARGASGTLGFMPPEQLRAQGLDERTDEWALAATAYEALANANPFGADTAEGSLFHIEVADVPLPTEFEPTLPGAVDDVLLAALAPHPDDRYPSVAAFGEALLPHLGDAETGRESLATIVSEIVGDDATLDDLPRPPLWDRVAHLAGVARRGGAGVITAWLTWTGLVPFSLGAAPLGAAVAIATLGAVLAPGLGLALGIGAFTAGLAVAAGPAWAALFAVPAVAVWAWRGRRGSGDALLPFVAPALGVARASLAAPLVAGFVFDPLPAVASSVLAAATTMVVSALTGAAPPYLDVDVRFFADPWSARVMASALRSLLALGPAAAALGWGAAAGVMSLFCRGGRRLSVLFGTVAAAVVLWLAYLPWHTSGGPTSLALLSRGGIALMVITAVAAFGPPVRGSR